MRCRPPQFRWHDYPATLRPGKNEVSADLVVVAVVLLLALTSCGKRGAPEPPPDVPNTYPMPYPSE